MSNEERFGRFHSPVFPNDKGGKRFSSVLKMTRVAARGPRNASRWVFYHSTILDDFWNPRYHKKLLWHAVRNEQRKCNEIFWFWSLVFRESCVDSVCSKGARWTGGSSESARGQQRRKIQQKAQEEYAGLWRIETIASKGDTAEPDMGAFDNKTDGTWVLFADDKEFNVL